VLSDGNRRERRSYPLKTRPSTQWIQCPGRHRWAIERTLAWSARARRLTVRHERRLDIPLASHLLAAGLIGLRFVERWSCRALQASDER
jgi:hypothetical protein